MSVSEKYNKTKRASLISQNVSERIAFSSFQSASRTSDLVESSDMSHSPLRLLGWIRPAENWLLMCYKLKLLHVKITGF